MFFGAEKKKCIAWFEKLRKHHQNCRQIYPLSIFVLIEKPCSLFERFNLHGPHPTWSLKKRPKRRVESYRISCAHILHALILQTIPFELLRMPPAVNMWDPTLGTPRLLVVFHDAFGNLS